MDPPRREFPVNIFTVIENASRGFGSVPVRAQLDARVQHRVRFGFELEHKISVFSGCAQEAVRRTLNGTADDRSIFNAVAGAAIANLPAVQSFAIEKRNEASGSSGETAREDCTAKYLANHLLMVLRGALVLLGHKTAAIRA